MRWLDSITDLMAMSLDTNSVHSDKLFGGAPMNKIDINSFPNRTHRHVLKVTVIQMFVWWESKRVEK